jgi:hypothetical protein
MVNDVLIYLRAVVHSRLSVHLGLVFVVGSECLLDLVGWFGLQHSGVIGYSVGQTMFLKIQKMGAEVQTKAYLDDFMSGLEE